jgi:pimeloyl-ACP methyl ester carboxylesterase
MHLVGHSYGGVISLLAAAHRPEAVRSLTVIEPPAFGLVENDPEHAPFVAKLRRFFADPSPDPETFLKGFIEVSGSTVQLPSPLPPPLEQNARVLMGERFPGDAVIPLEGLRSAAFPKLVVSGAHNRAFTAVCDVLTRSIGAERAIIPGKAHSVQRTGAPFNGMARRVPAPCGRGWSVEDLRRPGDSERSTDRARSLAIHEEHDAGLRCSAGSRRRIVDVRIKKDTVREGDSNPHALSGTGS